MLQRHLWRAAKAFLEPGLHSGTLSVEDAARVLRDDVTLFYGTGMQLMEFLRLRVQDADFLSPADHDS